MFKILQIEKCEKVENYSNVKDTRNYVVHKCDKGTGRVKKD